MNDNVSVIELPKENFRCPEGKNMAVSGWGNTWLNDEQFKRRDKARFLMMSDQQKCLDKEKHCGGNIVGRPTQYKDGIICSGDLEGPNSNNTENSACHNDSGGNKNDPSSQN